MKERCELLCLFWLLSLQCSCWLVAVGASEAERLLVVDCSQLLYV